MRGTPYDGKDAGEKIVEWGLSGAGPWRVLLPAYQMRAFQQVEGALPYTPNAADHPFQDV
jgi:hypothetical protein